MHGEFQRGKQAETPTPLFNPCHKKFAILRGKLQRGQTKKPDLFELTTLKFLGRPNGWAKDQVITIKFQPGLKNYFDLQDY